jgi:acetolactate synthase I/II/III large subunit
MVHGFVVRSGELATAVQYDIPAIVILFNDNAYGNVKRAQEEQFGGRVIGTDLVNPDFVALARSFGVRAARVPLASREFGSAEGLKELLQLAVKEQKPWLIEVPVGPMERTY